MITSSKRTEESRHDFAERMAAKTQYGERASRNRVYLHPDDWKRIISILRASTEASA
jgi:hypothetical protein